MKALIFDMDGTLTEPRQPISNEMIEVLRKLPNSYKKYLVTGSDMAKVEEQIPVEFYYRSLIKFLLVMAPVSSIQT